VYEVTARLVSEVRPKETVDEPAITTFHELKAHKPPLHGVPAVQVRRAVESAGDANVAENPYDLVAFIAALQGFEVTATEAPVWAHCSLTENVYKPPGVGSVLVMHETVAVLRVVRPTQPGTVRPSAAPFKVAMRTFQETNALLVPTHVFPGTHESCVSMLETESSNE
jgi:hypothetical protein